MATGQESVKYILFYFHMTSVATWNVDTIMLYG